MAFNNNAIGGEIECLLYLNTDRLTDRMTGRGREMGIKWIEKNNVVDKREREREKERERERERESERGSVRERKGR